MVDRGTKPSSSMISRLRRDSCHWRLTSRLSSRAPAVRFTSLSPAPRPSAVPQRGSPGSLPGRAYCGDMTTWSVAGGTSPRASLSM